MLFASSLTSLTSKGMVSAMVQKKRSMSHQVPGSPFQMAGKNPVVNAQTKEITKSFKPGTERKPPPLFFMIHGNG